MACDRSWVTIRGAIHGRIGDVRIAHTFSRDAGGWAVDGEPVAGLEDVVDLDVGFTPATNLLQLRRVGLAVGAAAEVPVAWFDGESASKALVRLPQRYERRRADTSWYESPTADYTGELVVGADGFALRYPGPWEVERGG